MRRRHHHRRGGFEIASTSPFQLFNGANSYGAGRKSRMRRGWGWRKAKQMEPMEPMGGRRRRR